MKKSKGGARAKVNVKIGGIFEVLSKVNEHARRRNAIIADQPW
jgi:hypothetical protein